jgi:hypothetical protein
MIAGGTKQRDSPFKYVYLTYVKKPLTIFFTALYVITVVGVTVAVHFCGETVTSVQVIQFASREKTCGCEETDVPDDCCRSRPFRSMMIKPLFRSISRRPLKQI